MSSFFSNKFLRYNPLRGIGRGSGAAGAAAIDTDIACIKCGYNLRGLSPAGKCPECGHLISDTPGISLSGRIPHGFRWIPADEGERRRFAFGFAAASACLAGAMVVRFVSALPVYLFDPAAYAWVWLAISVGWVAAVWMTTPLAWDGYGKPARITRRVVVLTQSLWPCVFAVIMVLASGTAAGKFDALLNLIVVLGGTAGIVGLLAYFGLLLAPAWDIGRDDVARRLESCIWGVGFFSLAMVLFPTAMMWFMFLTVFVPFVAVWAWFMAWSASCFVSLASTLWWSDRLIARDGTKLERIAEKREQIDREVVAGIRPMPGQPVNPERPRVR